MVSVLVRRARMASRLTALVATLLLTAAVFFLPSPGDGRAAFAAVDDTWVATSPSHDAGLIGPVRD